MRKTSGGTPLQGTLASALIASIPGTILILNPMGRILFLSTTDDDVLGDEPDFWLGQSALDLFHPDDLPLVVPRIDAALQGDNTPRQIIQLRVRTDDHRWFPVEAYGFNPITFEGAPAVVVSVRDTTRYVMFKRARQFARRSLEPGTSGASGPALEICDRRQLIDDVIPSMFMHHGQADQLMLLGLRLTNYAELATRAGAQTASQALLDVAHAIDQTCRSGDLVLRAASNKLLVALSGVNTHQTALSIAERARELAERPHGQIAFEAGVEVAVISQADNYDEVLDHVLQTEYATAT